MQAAFDEVSAEWLWGYYPDVKKNGRQGQLKLAKTGCLKNS